MSSPVTASPSKTDTAAITRCQAVDAFRNLCATPTEDGRKWCRRHDAQRIKLYAGYKAHHAALDALPRERICHSVKAVRTCASYDRVKGWSQAMRTKYKLLNRCITARACFTERFFGNDMDFGHKTFWHSLRKQLTEVESMLEVIEDRAYELLLASHNALWVLDKDEKEKDEDCGRVKDAVPKKEPKPETTSAPEPLLLPSLNDADSETEEEEDPVDVAIREKSKDLRERIRGYLATFSCPSHSRFYGERVKVIWTAVCRAIFTDPALMLVAQNYPSVSALLADESLDVPFVERLWNSILALYVHDVRAAIDDVLYPVREGGDYITVCGHRIHKERSGNSLTLHGWGHMHAFFTCLNCIQKTATTVEDIVMLNRHAHFTGLRIYQEETKYRPDYDSFRSMGLSGFVPIILVPQDVTRFEISKENCFNKQSRPHWEEIKHTFPMAVGLSLKDPKTQLFVNACIRHPDFAVVWRKGKGAKVISTGKLISRRCRFADTRAGLKTAPWLETEDEFYSDRIIDEARYEVHPNKIIDDCFQLVIIDHSDCEMEQFIDKLVVIWHEIHEVEDIVDLFRAVGQPFVAQDELEIEPCLVEPKTKLKKNIKKQDPKRVSPFIPDVSTNFEVSYKRLWGKKPVHGIE